MLKPDILVYQDYVHNNGQLYAALTRVFGHGAVGFCDAADILGGVLGTFPRLLVMPGGADLYLCEKLNGPGNRAIRAYVEAGGAYLGICSGAYYACAAIAWAKGTDHSITGPRELAFYDGTATGPVTAFIEDGDIKKSWLHAPVLRYGDAPIMTCYEGGPVFTGGTATVLARYDNGDAAIVECTVGKGKAILSSPHIETITPVVYRNNNPHFDHDSRVVAVLRGGEAARSDLWHTVLHRLVSQQERAGHAA